MRGLLDVFLEGETEMGRWTERERERDEGRGWERTTIYICEGLRAALRICTGSNLLSHPNCLLYFKRRKLGINSLILKKGEGRGGGKREREGERG